MKKYDNILLSTRKYRLQRDFWINYLQDLQVEPILQGQTGSHDREHQRKAILLEPPRIDFVLQPEISEGLIKLSKNSDETLYIVILSALISFLYRYTGKNDIFFCTPVFPVSGKKNLFNDLLVFRKVIDGDKTFKDILLEVRKTFMEVIENQDYPFEKIVEELEFLTDRTYDILLDLIFASANIHTIPVIKDNRNNLLVSFHKNENHIKVSYEINGGGYTRGEIEMMAKCFNKFLASLAADLSAKLSETELLDEEEKKRLLFDFNDTAASYPCHKTIHELFAEQVERTPQGTALMHEGHHITYRILNKQSNQLAWRLGNMGAKGDQIVGILARYSPELIIGILGILKAGAAYLPLDGSSKARSRFMLKDSGTKLVVISKGLPGDIFREIGEINGVYPDQVCSNVEVENADQAGHINGNTIDTCGPTSLAYIIYTSGTTGKPKGVMIQHQGLVNYIYWAAKKYVKNERLYFPLHTSISFDLTVTSIFTPLLTGQAMVIYGGEAEGFSVAIEKVIDENKVGVVKLTPSHLKLIRGKPIKGSVSSVKRFIVGGEELNTQLAGDIVKCFPGKIEIYNEYGPTEATVGCMLYQFNENVDVEKKFVPIGIPADNVQIYILDRAMRIVPLGITGEIYISGHGLARGYLNQPELTAEKFLAAGRCAGQVNEKLLRGVQGPAARGAFRVGSPMLEFPNDLSYASFGSKPSHLLRAKSQEPRADLNSPPGRRRQKFYKTGDLARMLPDGNLEFLGRIDEQVKIRGYRIEVEEIERQLLTHDKIKEVVVAARENQGGEKYLCAYIVPSSSKATASLSAAQLRKFVSRGLPVYMIPSYFMIVDKIPLTPNGKVDRKALPDLGTDGTAEGGVASRDLLEKTLEKLWRDVLFSEKTQEIEKKTIGIDANFFELGGHSLNATILVSKIHKVLNVKVSLTQMFKAPTIRGLAEYIKDTSAYKYSGIEVVPQKDYYTLSSAQKRLYILHLMDEGGTRYNIPSVVKLKGVCDKVRLEDTFKKLIKRHDSLRTSFMMIEDEPVQRIHPEVEFKFESYYQDSRPYESTIKSFFRPFDLSLPPLLRVGLIKVDDHTPLHLLMVDMHHIISDGVSMEIFIREFMALYAGEELAPLRLQYKDYAQWQNNEQESDTIIKQESYWVKMFEGEIPVLTLPTDFPRPLVQDFAGDRLNFEIGEADTQALRSLALEEGVTLYMILVALLNVFLAKISSQEDIIFGTPIAGRRHVDLIDIIGMFVNTLALRNHVHGRETFKEFLEKVKDNTLEAFENQEYQYENLVEKVAVIRDTSRNPLFDVMLVMQNVESPKIEIEGLSLEPYEYNNYTSKFDLMLEAIDADDILLFTFEYATRLFKKETIRRFCEYFKKIVSRVIENPDLKISGIEVISGEEKQKLLYDFNTTVVEFPRNKTIHDLVVEQVERTPDRVALAGSWQLAVDKGIKDIVHISYGKLQEQSNRLAHRLREEGVRPDILVGIMLERSIEMIIGIMGILKAGAAYLPIDIEYPQDRVMYMLTDSRVKVLVTLPKLRVKVGGEEGFMKIIDICLLLFSSTCSTCQVRSSSRLSRPGTLAYTIYTSGTTGRPKGILVEHHSVVNFVFYQKKYFDINENDRILQFSSICFDASVEQIFLALSSGAVLVLIARDILLDLDGFEEFLSKQRITHLHAVPSFLKNVGMKSSYPLKRVISGGDNCPAALVKKWNPPQEHKWNFYNKYGPTETAVTSIEMRVEALDETLAGVPIGKPLGNTFTYLFDKWMKLVPLGVPGELYIGGEGVARGYVNKPELTAEKFCLRRPGGSLGFALNSWILARRRGEEFEPSQADDRLLKEYNFEEANSNRLPAPRGPDPRKSFPLNHSPLTTHHSPLYKTGDLARWLPDGNIEFLGRIDHQVKLRGYRIELGEIESQLSKHKEVKEAVVTVKEMMGGSCDSDGKGDKYLCAYFISEKNLNVSQLKEYLSGKVPDYMIPSYFVQLEKIPLTPNGKVHTRALPVPGPDTGKTIAVPRDKVEEKLVEIWTGVLEIPKSRISIYANFFDLGGHSLKAAVLVSKIQKQLYVKVPLVVIFKGPTIHQLAQYVKNAGKTGEYTGIEAVEKKEYYALSFAQQRLYFLWQMNPGAVSYNLPHIITMTGKPDRKRIAEIFQILIKRHESLRTSFGLIGGEPVQRIHQGGEVKLELNFYQADAGDKVKGKKPCQGESLDSPIGIEMLTKNFIRPFELSQAPLFRMEVITLNHQKHLLLFDIHHIVSDGISFIILLREFTRLYEGKELPALRIQYKDFSQWENVLFKQGKMKKQEAYWLERFSSSIPVLQMPSDYQRQAVQTSEGAQVPLEIPPGLTVKIKAVTLATQSTLFMVLLAAWNILLSKYTEQEDIVVGSPIAGRNQADLENIIGMFVNTLAVRNQPKSDKTIAAFLEEVKENALNAYENQDYPFDALVNKLGIPRQPGRNPLVETLFVSEDVGTPELKMKDLEFMPREFENAIAHMDLVLYVKEYADRIGLILEYATALYKRSTAEEILRHYVEVLDQVVSDTGMKLESVQISHDFLEPQSNILKENQEDFEF